MMNTLLAISLLVGNSPNTRAEKIKLKNQEAYSYGLFSNHKLAHLFCHLCLMWFE